MRFGGPGIDVVGVPGRKSILGTQARTGNHSPCSTARRASSRRLQCQASAGRRGTSIGGDTSAPPCGHMPEGGHFFDTIVRQDPIDEDRLDPADNFEEYAP